MDQRAGNRTRSIAFRGKVTTRDEALPMLKQPGDAAVVERNRPRMLILRCPCGCGDDLIINLDRQSGPAWQYYHNRRGVTLYPSYWREGGCESHFIVWNGHIYWCMRWDRDETDDWSVPPVVEEEVLQALSARHFVHYYQLAQDLALVPWEALQACRQLVRREVAVAGKRKQLGEFRRTDQDSVENLI
jgi:hypothetical protein